MIPNEILLEIYHLLDVPSRITMNRSFLWSFKFANPYNGLDVFPPPIHKPENYIMRRMIVGNKIYLCILYYTIICRNKSVEVVS